MDSKQQENLYNYLIKPASWEGLRSSLVIIFFSPKLLKRADCGKGCDIFTIFIHDLCGHKCPKERWVILPSQGMKNASEIGFVAMAMGFDYLATVDVSPRENGGFYTEKDRARQQAPACVTVVFNYPTSSFALEDRVHPEKRKLTIFSVVQVELKDPEIHGSWTPWGKSWYICGICRYF